MLPPSRKSWSHPPVTERCGLTFSLHVKDRINGASYEINSVLIWITASVTCPTVIWPSFVVDKSLELNRRNKQGFLVFFSFPNWTFFQVKYEKVLETQQNCNIYINIGHNTNMKEVGAARSGLASLEWSLTFVSFVDMFTKDQHLSHIIHIRQNKDWTFQPLIFLLGLGFKVDLIWTSCKYQELGIVWLSEAAEPQSSHVQLACDSNSL